MAILSKGLSSISVIHSGYIPVSLPFPFTQCTVIDIFMDVLLHAFPAILTFDEMIGFVYSLVS